MHQSSLEFDKHPALVMLTGSPSAARSPPLDFDPDKCTADDNAMGAPSKRNTKSNNAKERANQGTGGCAAGTRNRKLCRGSSLKVLQLDFKKTRSLAPSYGHASGTTLLDCDGCMAPLSWWGSTLAGATAGYVERAITT